MDQAKPGFHSSFLVSHRSERGPSAWAVFHWLLSCISKNRKWRQSSIQTSIPKEDAGVTSGGLTSRTTVPAPFIFNLDFDHYKWMGSLIVIHCSINCKSGRILHEGPGTAWKWHLGVSPLCWVELQQKGSFRHPLNMCLSVCSSRRCRTSIAA